MGTQKVPEQPGTFEQWVPWFKENILPEGLDDPTIPAFLRHFADLGLLENAGPGTWKLSGIDRGQGPDKAKSQLLGRMKDLSEDDKGFALKYLLGFSGEDTLSAVFPEEPTTSRPQSKEPGNTPLPEKASDLSNLQIVKKVGRQLRPFLELEKKVVSKLKGIYTTREDSQKIFHYILGKSQTKAKPKKWEQLSRKRHR